jgi:hypothetical protein
MNRNVSAQISYDRLNKGVDVRNASTSNFLVSSSDREPYIGVYSTGAFIGALAVSNPCNFTINKVNSLFNGFFTRAAVSEVNLWWNKFNISPIAGAGPYNGNQAGTYFGTNTFTVTVLGVTKNFTMPPGFYNVAQCLDAMLLLLNQAAPAGFGAGSFTLVDSATVPGAAFPTNLVQNVRALVNAAGNDFYFTCQTLTIGGNTIPIRGLADMLSFPTFPVAPPATSTYPFYYVASPNLQAYPYIDFTSQQITAVQDLKDTSTAQNNPDTLHRWVMADDVNAPIYDTYGYPILMGYKPFKIRRSIAFPKQIRLDPLLPIGQVNFTLVDNNGNQITLSQAEQLEYNMLMLISEV